MKRTFLFIRGANQWNRLLKKFKNIYKRQRNTRNNISRSEYLKLTSKLKNIFSKLERMQYQTGLKIAGTALAIMLSSSMAEAQTFEAGVKLQAGGIDIAVGTYSSPVFADIDKDNDLDLYVGNGTGNVLVFTNDGDVFTPAGNLLADALPIVVEAASPKFADLDGDGDLDLYVGGNDGMVKVFTNNGGDFFDAGYLQGGGLDITANGTPAHPVFADFEGDGDLDLYLYSKEVNGKNTTYMQKTYTNDGSGALNPYGTTNQPDYVEFVDINNPEDYYFGSPTGELFFDSNGTREPVQAEGANINVGTYARPALADLDGDGDLDLYVGSANGDITVFINKDISTGIQVVGNDFAQVYSHESVIYINLAKAEKSTITVFDLSGRTVKELQSSEQAIQINNLKEGTYIVKVNSDKGNKVEKIFVK